MKNANHETTILAPRLSGILLALPLLVGGPAAAQTIAFPADAESAVMR